MKDPFGQLYVFELANNHQGDLEHGLAIVEAMARIARAHRIRAAAKLQLRALDSFIHPDYRGRSDVKHISRFESTRLPDPALRALAQAIREAGLVSIATPFDEPSVQTCQQLGIEILKVASCSATDWPLLTAIAGAGKPVIASTGGLGIHDIDNLVSFLGKRVPALALMHCVGLYPTPPGQVGLGFMRRMARRYPNVPVGYSGHEPPDNTDVVIAAIAAGARVLERHVGLPSATVKLNAYSLDPAQADAWVAAAERARAILGEGETKHVSQAELDSLRELQRGVYAQRPLKAGEPIAAADVFFAMPCAPGQLTAGEFGQLRARYTASRDYAAGEALHERAPHDAMRELRGILHDAKGQLYEAGIMLSGDYTIELSHHYGMERFREVGCILITLVNREYCHKLLVMLPGQRHPTHWHERKEETFHLLWGDMDLDMDGATHRMAPGDRLLIERGMAHAFRSRGGAICAEVSTRHIVGDSRYEDPAIAELDPMQRKTVLETW